MIFGPNTFIFCPNSFIFCTKSKTNIFNSTSHSFHDLDFYFKFNPIYYIFVPKFYFPSQTLKNYFKFHLSFSYMLVIIFIFYPNDFIICFKNSFSISKTFIFSPKKFIFCPIGFINIFNSTSPFFACRLLTSFYIPNILFHNQNISFSSQKILISVPIVSCFCLKFHFLSRNSHFMS